MLLLTAPLLATAVPASPRPVKWTNPDGSTIDILIKGDEYFHFYTDADSRFIMEQDKTGKWQIAEREGMRLEYNADNVRMLKSELPAGSVMTRAGEPSRMAPLDTQGRTNFPTTSGEVHSIVVLLEYADTPFTVPNPRQAFDDYCNKENYSAYRAYGSASDYFRINSGGRFIPKFDVYGPIKLSHDKAWYAARGTNLNGAGKNARFGCAMEEALKYLDEVENVDFSKYDLDGDGDIDNFYFFYSGYGQADSNDKDAIWPHQSDFTRFTKATAGSPGLDPLYLDGKRVGPYACSNELDYTPPRGESQPWLAGIGTFCHEFGHVIGFPDLYDTDGGNTKTPGKWDLMDQGSYNMNSTCPPLLSAWERWTCRWLEYDELEEGSVNTIKSLGTSDVPKAYRLRIQRPATTSYYNEYFVFECRSNDSYDQSLPEEGMLIWRINWNNSTWVNNTVNTGTTQPGVEILYSDGERDLTWPGLFEDYTTAYPGAPNAIVPYSRNPRFTPFITDIKYDSDAKTASFEYNVITERPKIATTMHENVEVVDENRRQLKLSWDPIEGVDKYLLTVYRNDVNGNPVKVDGLEESDVALNTSRIVKNISTEAWDQEFTAYVRAVQKVPAAITSNIISFTPSKLSTGVEDIVIGADNAIFGGVGCVIAPENAKVYNLSGIETGKDNLPAGIYIVKVADKTRKVVVK